MTILANTVLSPASLDIGTGLTALGLTGTGCRGLSRWPGKADRSPLDSSRAVPVAAVTKRMAYGFRDDAYFFLKIRAAFPGIP